MRFFLPFPCGNCGLAFPRWLMGLFKYLDSLSMVDYYKSGKSAADKLKSIRFEKSRQKYKTEHDDELRTFYMAERKLKPYFKDGKLPITAWCRERERLEQEWREGTLPLFQRECL